MSVLLDSLLTAEQRASCAIHDVPKEWPAEAAHACTEVGYEDEIRRMEGDPWVFWAVVIGVIGGMVLSL